MKKYISLILSFLIIVSCANNVIAFSSDEMQSLIFVNDETEKYFTEVSNLFSALGIEYFVNDGRNSNVIRRDFICALAQIMNFHNLSSVEHSFSDIGDDGELSVAVGHALRLGIISESDNFRPFDNITYDEAYKICVVAAGYALEGQMRGGYPFGYNTTATQLNLTVGITGGVGAITSQDAMTLLKNLGDTPIRRQTAFGDVNEYATDEDITFFSYYRNLFCFEGIVMANEITSVYSSADKTKAGCVRIGEKEYECSFSVAVGSRVNGYYVREEKINKVVCISDVHTQTLIINSDDVESVSETQITYSTDSKKSSKVKIKTAPAVIYNTVAYEDFSVSDLRRDETEIILFENDGDNIYDVIHIRKPTYMLVDRVDAYYEYIFDVNGGMLDLSGADKTYSLISDNKHMKLSELESGSVLTIYESADKKSCEIIVTDTSSVAVINEKDDDTLYIDGVGYKYNSYFKQYYLPTVSLGKSYGLTFDSNGRITAIISGEDVKKFGYVVGYAPAEGLGNPKLKIFTQSSEFMIVDIPKNVSVNGVRRSVEDVESVFYAGGVCNPQIIQYTVTDDGMLKGINITKSETGIMELGESGIKRYIPSQESLKYRSNGIFDGKFVVNSNTTVFFNVSPDETLPDEKRYGIGNPFVSTNTYSTSSLEIYNLTDDMKAGAVVYKNYGSAKINYESSHGVVESLAYVMTEDKSEAVKVVMYSSGSFREYYITDESLIKNISTGNPSEPWSIGGGDYVRYSLSPNNEIVEIVKDYDYKSNTVINYGTDIQAKLCYCIGNVYDMGSGYIVLIPFGEEPTEDNRTVLHATTSNIVVFDRGVKRLQSGSRNDIITYKDSPELCTPVLVRIADNYYSTMVVYTGEER